MDEGAFAEPARTTSRIRMIQEVIAPTRPKLEFIVAPEIEPPYRVLIHNDDVTPMDFVTAVLRTIFELPLERAAEIMLTAHHTGVAYVGTYSREEAERRIGEAHMLARRAEYPLTFSMEPEN